MANVEYVKTLRVIAATEKDAIDFFGLLESKIVQITKKPLAKDHPKANRYRNGAFEFAIETR